MPQAPDRAVARPTGGRRGTASRTVSQRDKLFRSYEQSLGRLIPSLERRMRSWTPAPAENLAADILLEAFDPVLRSRGATSREGRSTRRALGPQLETSLQQALTRNLGDHLCRTLDARLTRWTQKSTAAPAAKASSPWPGPIPTRPMALLARETLGRIAGLPPAQRLILVATLAHGMSPDDVARTVGMDDPGHVGRQALTLLNDRLDGVPSDTLRGFLAHLIDNPAAPPDLPAFLPVTLPPAGPTSSPSLTPLGPLAFDLSRLSDLALTADVAVTLRRLADRQPAWSPLRPGLPRESMVALRALAFLVHRLLAPAAPSGRGLAPAVWSRTRLKARLDPAVRALLATS